MPLLGIGKIDEYRHGEWRARELQAFCEGVKIFDDGSWFFQKDFVLPDRTDPTESSLSKLLATDFETLLEIKRRDGGTFQWLLQLPAFGLPWLTLSPDVVSMSAVLDVSLELSFARETSEKTAPDPPGETTTSASTIAPMTNEDSFQLPLIPYLYGGGKSKEGKLSPAILAKLKTFCEEVESTDDGQWSLRADICTADYLQLFSGELFDFLTGAFTTLLQLKTAHGGDFHLMVTFSASTLVDAQFRPEVVNMCSALGMSIDVVTVDEHGRPLNPPQTLPLPG